MESGDLENGYRAWAALNVHAYTAGYPLESIIQTSSKLLQQLKQYSVEAILVSFFPFRFTLLQLMGSAESPIDWNELKTLPSAGANPSEAFRWIWFFWSRLQLAFYFGKLELADKLVEPFRVLSAIDTCYIVVSIRVFFSGLTASGMARRCGKRKYFRRAMRSTAEMRKIMRTRGLNNLHRYLLMQADLAACCKRKRRTIKDLYDKAIAAASKAGFVQDAALGNEMAAEYFLSVNDGFWSKHYFTRALELYLEWGARAKVDHLLQTRGDYINVNNGGRRRSSIPSSIKHWVSGDDSQIHNSLNLDLLSGQTPLTEFSSTSRSHLPSLHHENENFSFLDSHASSLTVPSALPGGRRFGATQRSPPVSSFRSHFLPGSSTLSMGSVEGRISSMKKVENSTGINLPLRKRILASFASKVERSSHPVNDESTECVAVRDGHFIKTDKESIPLPCLSCQLTNTCKLSQVLRLFCTNPVVDLSD